MTRRKKQKRRQRLLKSPKNTIDLSTMTSLRTTRNFSSVCHSLLMISGVANLVGRRNLAGSVEVIPTNQDRLPL